jgi:cysteine desulfurase
MHRSTAYLDHNATAPVKPAVREAVLQALELGGNPSSVHRRGRLARRAVERARAQVAALVGAVPDQVVFTSGATEANQLALLGLGDRRRLASAIEHDSVLSADTEAMRLPVDGDGVVDLAALEQALRLGGPAIVSIMLANNETGVIQPVVDVAAIVHRHGALLHCDAVQAPGRLALDMAALGVDLLTLSAHKIGGPQGVGALVLREGIEVAALLRGGGQEFGRRAGTENVPGIVGFGTAAALAAEDLATISEVGAMRDDLEQRLRRTLPSVVVFAAAATRLANTSCLAMPGVAAENQVMALDLAGVAVSAGAACSSGTVKASRVLAAMGVDAALAASAIRVSLGPGTEAWEIERFVTAWVALWGRAGARRQDATRAEG